MPEGAQRIVLPASGWQARDYQRGVGDAFRRGILRHLLFWHRRAGKDDVALHRTAMQAHRRVGTYWHMLPEASQARKAIWAAVDPHLQRRRIDIAFPLELRSVTRENEMFIGFRNGSTWQVVGSDNYNSLLGSPPVGLVSSEHALANPAAWAHLRPILEENAGWLLAITTPRGKNHAYHMLQAHKHDPAWFTQVLPATETGVFTAAQLAKERADYISEYGEDQGIALFEQEYLCSFDAAILGSYFGGVIKQMGARLGHWPYTPGFKVHSAWDLGYRDSSVIWLFQVIANRPIFFDLIAASGLEIDDYIELLGEKRKEYGFKFGDYYLPHDAKAHSLQTGKSIQDRLIAHDVQAKIVPDLSVQDGINATRRMLGHCCIDEEKCAIGVEALKQYQREWDEDKRAFKQKPVHDWTSDYADAMRMGAIGWEEEYTPPAPFVPPRLRDKPPMSDGVTLEEMWKTLPQHSSRSRI